MSFISLVLIAFGLSMDAFAVSITNGIVVKHIRLKDALRIGAFFGFFQALMPLTGWALGINFKSYIVAVDHWIAFILLGFIGIRMIISTLKEEKEQEDSEDISEDEKESENPLSFKVLLLLSIATSIDALAVGISFAFLNVKILSSALVIGLITFLLSSIGVLIGKKFGDLFQKKAEIIGGAILTLIGLKILIEHTDAIEAVLKFISRG